MAKKHKKKYRRVVEEESPTKPFRQVAGVTMGAGMASSLVPLMRAPTPGNIQGATEGMVGFAILAPMAGVGFNAIDNIYKSGQPQKKKK